MQADVRVALAHGQHERRTHDGERARRHAHADVAREARGARGAGSVIGMAQRQLGLAPEGEAGIGRHHPVEVRWSSRVDSSLSSRLICWLSADVTTPSRWAACPMLPNSTTCTK